MNNNGSNFTNGHSGGANNPAGNRNKVNSNELIDLKRFYSITKRYLWLIILCAVIGLATAYYLAYEYLLPVYQSESTVLIEGSPNNFPGTSSEIGQIISSSYNLTSNGSVASEIQFIKSRELSQKVAEQILAAKYLPDSSIYPLLWSSYPDDSTIVLQETLAGRIRGGLSVKPIEQGSSILSVSFQSYSPHEAARIVNFSINAYKDITAAKKRISAQSALEFLEEEKAKLKEKLDQAENRLSGFKSNQNLVALQSQAANSVNTGANLEAQKTEITINLESLNSVITNLQNQLDAIRPGLGDKYSQATGPVIKKLQEELSTLKTERFILVSNNPQLKANPQSEPKMRELDRKINDIEIEIKRLTDNLVAENEGSLGFMAGSGGDVNQEISNIQQRLTDMQIQKSQYEAQLQAIDGRLSTNEAFINRVPDNEKQLARFEREAQILEELFLTVSKQASEVSLWSQTRSGAGTVIDYAQVSWGPVSPQKPIWLVMGFLIGLCVPMGFILLKEALNQKINSIKDLSDGVYPLLAVIYDHSILDKKKTQKISESSHGKSKKISNELILYHYGLSPVAESYRSLVSKILYSHPDTPPKTLLITSPAAGEGKTTLTANMATALTEIGKRVLIVDCDMRKPGIPGFFGISKEPGIMEVLFKDQALNEVVRSLPIPGLDVLTTGRKQPARPNSVIGSQAFKNLLEKFKLDYDFILLDSAPFGIIGDVAPILQLTDGVIVNTKFRSTTSIQLDYTIEQLENNSAQILGVVLNSFDPKKSIDDAEVKGLYTNMYNSYYDYHEPNTKREKYSHGKYS